MDKSVYQYEPTGTGFKVSIKEKKDPLRTMVCPLYPDNDRRNVFSQEELSKLELYTFRPVVFAMLSPRYQLELDSLSGMSGYGRFAVVTNAGARWLDQFEELETAYVNGELCYCARDPVIPGRRIHVTFSGTTGAVGLVARLDLRELERDVRVYFVHGGMLGWNMHSPLALPYSEDMCYRNVVTLRGGHSSRHVGEICLDHPEEGSNKYRYEGLKEIPCNESRTSSNCAWRILEGRQRKIVVRILGGQMCIAPPEALHVFDEKVLREGGSAWGGVLCGQLASGQVNYVAAGSGERIEEGNLEELFYVSHQENLRMGHSLVVETGDTALDGAVRMGAYAAHAIFGDNVLLHGSVSWREPYLGWRLAYGPLAYGMTREVYQHFDTHFRKSVITQGVDRGAVMYYLEYARPDAVTSYNMYETFMDQAKHYWEHTGDKEFARRLFPVVEGCIEREIRRLKPGEEWLFENSLNTWISDSHWTILGQCTQASAYMYNCVQLAADLADVLGKETSYRQQAARIREDMQRILWQKPKGVFAYSQELRGNKLLHPQPELADVYHTVEFGVADRYQAYQMFDWIEANLRRERTDNGGCLYWSSNWYPNAGGTYTHSTYELNMGEEMNLALVYLQQGLAEQGYEIFKTAYMAIYGGRDPEIPDYDMEKYRAQGHPPMLTEVAGDIPCMITINGTPRRCPHFGDSIGMFGRVVYEGLLGIRPMLHIGEVWLSPCLPKELPEVTVKSAILNYRYERRQDELRIAYAMKPQTMKSCTLRLTFHLPVCEVKAITANGATMPYQVEPAFCGARVSVAIENAHSGQVCAYFAEARINPVEERRSLCQGADFGLDYPGEEVMELFDPQGITNHVQVEAGHVEGKIAGSEGSGVFFLKMRAGRAEYIRPVKLWIQPPCPVEKKRWRGTWEEFEPPYEWKYMDMDRLFNASSPLEALETVCQSVKRPGAEYSQVNTDYYQDHLVARNTNNPLCVLSDARWRGMVDEEGMAMTGEGIGFRSKREGPYLAVTTVSATAYPDRVTVPIEAAGRAAYLLVTGATFPMQSGVENLRMTFVYEDGRREEHALVNPDHIGDMWCTLWGRYHDTPANGFENMGGHSGAMSSTGQDLSRPIATDTEAHILRFMLRPEVKVETLEFRTIANDAVFALMGVTLLK